MPSSKWWVGRGPSNLREHLEAVIVQLLVLYQTDKAVAPAVECQSLLSFDLWKRLIQQYGWPRARVRALLIELLLAALGPEPRQTTTLVRRDKYDHANRLYYRDCFTPSPD